MSADRKAVIEMTGGALLAALGIFMSQQPLPGLPDMNHFLIHLFVSLGITAILCGVLFFLVGAARYADATWPDRIVERWDSMWTKKFAIRFIPVCLIGIFGLAFLIDARAQNGAPAAPNAPAPSSAPLSASGPCSTSIGGNNSGNINPDCRTYNYGPKQQPDGLYQSGERVGSLSGIHKKAGSTDVYLDSPRIDSSTIDLDKPIENQNLEIMCDFLKNTPKGANRYVLPYNGTVKCKAVGLKN